MKFDLAIIGAGPGGTDAAEHAAARGLKVVIFEKNKLGGVCLNEGCIPTKTLLHSAHLLAEAREGRKYGLSIPEAELELSKVMARKGKILKKLSAGIRMNLQNSVWRCDRGSTPHGSQWRCLSDPGWRSHL